MGRKTEGVDMDVDSWHLKKCSFFSFLAMSPNVWDLSSFPGDGIQALWQLKHGVLICRPPGNSRRFSYNGFGILSGEKQDLS